MEEKLFIHHGYDFVESGPAENVGTYRRKKLLRLLFIPFMYATPTYGDVVAVKRDPEFEGNYAFECPGPHGMEIDDLHQHGGRYALIVDFSLGDSEWAPWFPEANDIMTSLAWEEQDDKPGRLYIAAQTSYSPEDVMKLLAEGHPAAKFILIHPTSES